MPIVVYVKNNCISTKKTAKTYSKQPLILSGHARQFFRRFCETVDAILNRARLLEQKSRKIIIIKIIHWGKSIFLDHTTPLIHNPVCIKRCPCQCPLQPSAHSPLSRPSMRYNLFRQVIWCVSPSFFCCPFSLSITNTLISTFFYYLDSNHLSFLTVRFIAGHGG